MFTVYRCMRLVADVVQVYKAYGSDLLSTVYRCTRLVADVVQVYKACGSDLLSTVYRCTRRVHCIQVYETCG